MPRKFDFDKFIQEAKFIHNDKYDYSKTEYVSALIPIKIICPKHGVFEQRANHHSSGSGCQRCRAEKISRINTKPFSYFEQMAKQIHGERYIYLPESYKGIKSTVNIICSIHGEFKQRASHHAYGSGCPKCGSLVTGNARRSNLEEFIDKARKIHGSKYNYDSVIYVTGWTKAKMRCAEHGYFHQTPTSHLSGSGCPSCAKYGFNDTKTGTLYILRSEDRKFLKIGITNKLNQRMKQLVKNTPFAFCLLSSTEMDGLTVRAFETKIKRFSRSAGLNGFDGATEWIVNSPRSIENIKLTISRKRKALL